MKKFSSIALLLLFVSLPLFAQEDGVEDAPNAEVTEPVENNAAFIPAATTEVVTEENEVVTSGGEVYFDGEILYTSADVDFKIDAEDSGSGVKAIYVVLDGEDSFEYTDPISVDTEGKHAFNYQVEDNVGNVSESKTYSFVMDDTAPALAFTGTLVTGVSEDGEAATLLQGFLFGPNSTVGFKATDRLSGVKATYYSINGESETLYDAESFLADIKTGEIVTCFFYAVDNVGNVSEMPMRVYLYDSVGPETTITLDPEAFSRFDVNYISPTTLVTIEAEDENSTVETIEYSINGADFVEYNDPFTLAPGTYKIVARSYDYLENLGDETVVEVVVDGDSPTAEVVTTD